jgi:hypothetical protein
MSVQRSSSPLFTFSPQDVYRCRWNFGEHVVVQSDGQVGEHFVRYCQTYNQILPLFLAHPSSPSRIFFVTFSLHCLTLNHLTNPYNMLTLRQASAWTFCRTLHRKLPWASMSKSQQVIFPVLPPNYHLALTKREHFSPAFFLLICLSYSRQNMPKLLYLDAGH